MENIMAFPFAGYGVAGVFDSKPKVDGYSTALQNILTTPKGTLPYAPEFGSVLPLFVFDLNDDITKNLLLYYAYKDISEQEPRLRIMALDADFDVDNHMVTFAVSFVAYDDPTETVRTAQIGPVPVDTQGIAA